ncbi:trypsin-like serine protease [Bradyrhizobium sp. AZCC 2289]|uniref:trypsin-like serine protease n=1 Tax=Bradyrhizobium sp. AZCC 2289 TaxID=3117026 RepID=UPI002FF0E3D9
MVKFAYLVVLVAAQAVLLVDAGFAQTNTAISEAQDRLDNLQSEVTYRIVGGSLARDGAWPWQVVMYMRASDGQYNMRCGGSLIDSKWVLTAAHCIGAIKPEDYVFVEGTNWIDRNLKKKGGRGRALAVKRVVPHAEYSRASQENDIALFELAVPATSRPVSLSQNENSEIEQAARISTVTGWGTLRAIKDWHDLLTNDAVRPNDPRYFTDRLMEVDIPLVSEDVCRKAYNDGSSKIDHRVLCAGLREGGKDSCQGDSGGPLVTKVSQGQYAQIGVVSFGRYCALKESYGVYSKVSAFIGWIQKETGVHFVQSILPPSVQPAPPVVQPLPPPALPSASPSSPSVPPSGQPSPASASDNAAGVSVSFVQGETLKVGQKAQFRVTTEKPGYLLLIDITPDRKMTQVFPNARSLSTPTGGRQRSNYVESSSPLLVPNPKNPYEGFEFKTEPPFGEGLLVAILSAEPIQSITLPDAPKTMDPDQALEYFSKLTNELGRNLEIGGTARPRDWSFAVRGYRIIQ